MFFERSQAVVVESLGFLCRGLAKCKKLEEINFSDNEIGEECVSQLKILLSNGVCLKKLILDNCSLNEQAGEHLAGYLVANANLKLEVFSASKNKLSDGGFQMLARALGNMGTLKKILLAHCNVDAMGTMEFLKCIPLNPELEEFNIFDNVIVRLDC